MTEQETDISLEDWDIDLAQQKAQHKCGLAVVLASDERFPGKWIARKSNGVNWVQENFSARAPLLSPLLRAAVAAYERAYHVNLNTRMQ